MTREAALAIDTIAGVHPRKEFWSNISRWPRNCATHAFLGDVVLDLGPILFKEWTGSEPATIVIHPLWPVLDASTPPEDIQRAVSILSWMHDGYKSRANSATEAWQGMPLPTPDEWAAAAGIVQQISDESIAAYNRFSCVTRVLVRAFELNFVATAIRGHLAGEMRPLSHGWWINECFEAWFETCQVDPAFPFMRRPVRSDGDWLYVDLRSYHLWRDAAFGGLVEVRRREREAASGVPSGDRSAPAEGSGRPDSEVRRPTASDANKADDGDNAGTDGSNADQSEYRARPTEHSEPDRARAEARERRKPGAKAKFDWAAFEKEARVQMQTSPPPKSERALAAAMLQWCEDNWEAQPAESTVRAKLQELRRNGLQSGPSNSSHSKPE